MRISTWILSLTVLTVAALAACDPESRDPEANDDADAGDNDADRGHIAEDDLIGTCEGACDGQASDGNCWCDDKCAEFGDCCADHQDICGGSATCEGEDPSGCKATGCGEGQVCSTQTDGCFSSGCSCDETTGTWQCTPDCGGGECVPDPDPEPAVCAGDNPAGCSSTGCGDGQMCSTETEACISSACSCDETTMTWQCTPDCGGGVCVPGEPTGTCPGADPSQICIDGSCIPSGCTCDESSGAWNCTPDCGGGVEC